ncbi:glycoside hydrolase family 3 N-terminal domain-containing protein [Dactylosporangium sucinum]|uniref:Glycoside hydrolase family 3 N-terminal domain-containing protein n=1 Tax=Dactylosporangium sucinum TaxID=1424081 RepID=A0A917X740_9ACTN|nr:glycoside hydrolase family 3 N-terminal domain-containing protein [Dactylosporangium sucinum]GGM82769.1 hypothetical protein GCM10007977_100280 [Dactylosporangium sucinum]
MSFVRSLPLEVRCAQLTGLTLPSGLGHDPEKDRAELREMVPHGVGSLSLVQHMSNRDIGEMRRGIDAVQDYLVRESPGGIPALVHAEALNGLVWNGASSWPTAIGLAASFDLGAIERMAAVAAEQAAALGVQHGLSPVLDVCRDPRFGRVHETYGEDPTLAAACGVAFVRGLQASGDVLATGKHFLAYMASEGALNMAEVHAGPRELREVHALPFEAAIRWADLATVMNSYSAIDGKPVASSREILTALLRGGAGAGRGGGGPGVRLRGRGRRRHPGGGRGGAQRRRGRGCRGGAVGLDR